MTCSHPIGNLSSVDEQKKEMVCKCGEIIPIPSDASQDKIDFVKRIIRYDKIKEKLNNGDSEERVEAIEEIDKILIYLRW